MSQNFHDYFSKVKESADWFSKNVGTKPSLMIVLTGGVDGPLNEITNKKEIFAKDVPHFPTARAEGHAGKIIFGKFHDKDVVILNGRYHYYEGHSPQDVVFPYFVLHAPGVRTLITTNAVGGIRKDLNAGDIFLITDHINFMGQNPLRGIAMERKEHQFTDMTAPYSPEHQKLAYGEAKKLGIKLKDGVYIAVSGPSYETRSEISAMREWGADIVGMSTVFEVIACNFLGIKVLALSCVANPAADRHKGGMDHKEVRAAMNAAGPKLSNLVSACAERVLSC